jgi:hypothetical protein
VNDAQRFLNWTLTVRGTQEGSARHRRWAKDAGVSWTAPWCSVFIAYGLKLVGIDPPPNPAYSGAWLNWSEGAKVDGGLENAQPGDLLIFDWGDGGITDHVGAYLGDGRYVAGNNSQNTVGVSTVPEGNIVGIVRPAKFFGDPFNGGVAALPGKAAGAVVGVAEDVAGFGAEKAAELAKGVVTFLLDELGEEGARILLYIALVVGGAILIYYGLARAAGMQKPIGTPASLAVATATKGRA